MFTSSLNAMPCPTGADLPGAARFEAPRGALLFDPQHDSLHANKPLRLLRGVAKISPPDQPCLRLARAGEIIGLDIELGARVSNQATALTPVVLEAWEPASTVQARHDLITASLSAERSAFALNAFGQGSSEQRLLAVALFFSEPMPDSFDSLAITLPSGLDMSRLTGLTREAISRAITHLRESGLLRQHPLPGVPRPSAFIGRATALREGSVALGSGSRRSARASVQGSVHRQHFSLSATLHAI